MKVVLSSEKIIYVYADWCPYNNELIGKLYVSQIKGKEIFSFEYENKWLKQASNALDPDLLLYQGRQYVSADKSIFGIFSDSCPDRWGRMLMKRREEIRARKAKEKPRKLLESDFLLGVHDEARMGGLRFSLNPDGPFEASDKELATPPWATLRQLETASIAFENDESGLTEKWLRQLLAPGSSLGGARPKANVLAPDGSLWIAKFPSKHDEWNSGGWEMVTHELAKLNRLNVPEAKLETFSKAGSTFLVKRFDREGRRRIHFSSAMTLLGKKDGESGDDGSSYLDIASFIRANGENPKEDLLELWKRIVFGMAVSNTDDHLRNHGFILGQNGWRLSPMFDVNPNIYGDSLSLNVNKEESRIDYSLAIESATYFGINNDEATKIVKNISGVVLDNWKKLAQKYGMSRSAIQRMEPAFSLKL